MFSLVGDSLYKRISELGDPNLSVFTVLQQWINEGRGVKKSELQRIVKELRKYRRYKHALEVSEWIASRRNYQLAPSDCAIRLDLIAKVHGIVSAEKFFERLPDEAKNKLTLGALLNAYVKENMTAKAEAIVEKLKESGYAPNTLTYNSMMNLYTNTREFEKVPLMIQEMKKNGISLDKFSYSIWLTCVTMSDVNKMEEVIDEVKHDNNVNTDWTIYSTLAAAYIKAGILDKAESALEEVKSKMPQSDRSAYEYLITLYASAGKRDEVYKVWHSLKLTFPKPKNRSYICLLSSLVKIGDIEGAEQIFKEWESVCVRYDVRMANIFLSACVKKGLLEKAESLLGNLLERGGKPNFNTWEILAEGYIQNGKFEQAVAALKKSASVGKVVPWKPKPANVLAILKHFENRGDVESAEDLLKLLRDLNCVDTEMYNSLIRTYAKSGKADPGIFELMERDKVNRNEAADMMLRQAIKP
jgi:pentatricopeptide repeat protein